MLSITVLMSVYKNDKAEYLDLAVKSIWTDQTHKPDNIILIQDGPLNAELYFIIKKWKLIINHDILILHNEKNIGLTKSLNKGIQYVHTELIARMDSDDISAPDRFAKQLSYIEAHPEIDILGGYTQDFSDVNPCRCIRKHPLSHNEIVKSVYKGSPLCHATVMMKTSIFKKIKYDERFSTSQDIALWFSAIISGFKIANIDVITYYIRCDDNFFIRRNKQKAIKEWYIYRHGIKKIYGSLSVKQIYPFMRFIFRMMPAKFIKWMYANKLRNIFLENRL